MVLNGMRKMARYFEEQNTNSRLKIKSKLLLLKADQMSPFITQFNSSQLLTQVSQNLN
jgi:hypothetical protein